eukprot:TRINITY_DN9404_c0_g4_i2.p1 TRINITY_DN9404_c0_g4~~TRINITY_DN9404_c0_g4_i2.p1  ORF type:complete len:230 (+),score=27.46 TRINITY_DN9404_c0_g4_i2:197-886(+)
MATKKAGNLLGRYLALLHRRPFLTNMGTSTVLMMIGDTTAQQIERIQGHQSKLRSTAYTLVAPNSWMPHGIVVEPVRSTVLAFWAGCMGLFWTAWFRRMDILFRGVPKMMGVIGKVTVTAITPPFTNTAFLGMVTMIEETVINKRGDDVDFLLAQAQRKIDAELWATVKASWTFWSPTNFFAWTFLSPPLRVPFGSSMATLWNVYLSLVQHRAIDDGVKELGDLDAQID